MEKIIDFKIITLGNPFVGKTSIFKKYIYKVFGDTESTIGMNMYIKELNIKVNTIIKLSLVDTNGQDKYRAIPKQYIKNANGVLFVFSFDNPDSLQGLDQWIKIFKENIHNERKIPKFLIGNKNDLNHKVTEKEINDYLKKNPDFIFKSISAKTDDIKIDELFLEMANLLYEEYEKEENKTGKSVKLSSLNKDKKSCFQKCII